MTTDQQIGERLYVLMRRRGLTGVAAAKHLGLAQSTMSKKLRGDRAFSFDEFLRMCAWLDVAVDEVLREVKPVGPAETRCTRPLVSLGSSLLVGAPAMAGA